MILGLDEEFARELQEHLNKGLLGSLLILLFKPVTDQTPPLLNLASSFVPPCASTRLDELH
jgi:hypothetical protein